MKKEFIVIGILTAALLWFASTIIRLENYHYASQVGFCDEYSGLENLVEKDKCLDGKQSRDNSIWHLLYGLDII